MKAAIAILLMCSALIVYLAVIPALADDQDQTTDQVPGTGTITGVVTTGTQQAVPDAIVTLKDLDDNYIVVPDNPQYSSNGTGNNIGVYTFSQVPPGTYNVSAEKGDDAFFAIVTLDSGTATANVVLPNYTVTKASFPTPTPLPPKPYYTFVPVTMGKTPPQASGGGRPVGGLALTGSAALVLPFALVMIKRRYGRT